MNTVRRKFTPASYSSEVNSFPQKEGVVCLLLRSVPTQEATYSCTKPSCACCTKTLHADLCTAASFCTQWTCWCTILPSPCIPSCEPMHPVCMYEWKSCQFVVRSSFWVWNMQKTLMVKKKRENSSKSRGKAKILFFVVFFIMLGCLVDEKSRFM